MAIELWKEPVTQYIIDGQDITFSCKVSDEANVPFTFVLYKGSVVLDTVVNSPSRTYSKTYTGVSFSWEGAYFIRVTSAQGTVDSRTVNIYITPATFDVNYSGLSVDFSSSSKSYINNTLMASHKKWGGASGGTVVECIEIDRVKGVAKIASCGDNYTGSIKGVDRDGNPSGFNTRIGGCLVTKEYYGAGSYRVVAKGLQVKGACNAMWTFHYEEAYPENVSFWNEMIADGLHISGTLEDGYYYVRNHEIDIEFPSALKTNPNQEDVSFRNCRFNTWLGELRNWDVAETDPAYWSEYTDEFTDTGVDLDDGEYHEYRFDWHLGSNPRVEFYIDGVLKEVNTTHVPTIPGRFWVGNWFPSGATQWAGRPAAYDVEYMDVKSISIIPYNQYNDDLHLVPETYPNDVFREIPINESMFTKFRCLQHNWSGSAEWNTLVNETYYNSNYFVNRVCDRYTFKGEYILKNDDVKDLYNFWRVQRGNEFTFEDGSFGVTSMFGPQVTDSVHTAVISSITYEVQSAGYKRVTINLIKVG